MSERGSVWFAGVVAPEFPPLAGDVTADVVIAGAGITGLTTAVLLQRAGLEVVVLEAAAVASGTTGLTTGKVTSQHGLIYDRMVGRHGTDTARSYATANEDAIALVWNLAGDAADEVGLHTASAFVFGDEEDWNEIEAENRTASQLGLPSRIADAADLPFPAACLMEFTDQAYFHPVRYCHHLADMLVAGGGRIFEQSRVTALEETGDRVHVSANDARVTALHAVEATLLPFTDRSGAFARTRPSRAYGVAAILASSPPAGMYISAGEPVRSIRPWPEGGETGVIFVGETHDTGEPEATPGRWGELERWANEHFEVESFEYRWSAQDFSTADGIPYIGQSPFAERTWIATGFHKWGLSNGTAAARIITDGMTGVENPHAPAFDPRRIGGPGTLGRMVKDNARVARHLVGDRIARLNAPPIADLQPGDGGIVDSGGDTVAAYRDPAGELHVVSPTCTHLGCTVAWNDAEDTWDCPCHGSRFDVDGTVLNGPATAPLKKLDLAAPHAEVDL